MGMDRAGRQARIGQILQKNGVCACGQTHPVSLRALVMEPGGLDRLPGVLETLGAPTRLGMICDENTYRAARARVEELCRPAQVVCLPAGGLSPRGEGVGMLHATEDAVAWVEERLGPCDMLLAVGSGTVHDITRYVATARGLDFVSVPTAASVDGYLSSIAAMTWHGVKRSFPAKPPVAMVADSTVIAAAPSRLTAAGVGDLLGKYTALFDWRAAHMLTGEPACEQWVIPLEEEAIAQVAGCLDGVRAGDPEAVEAVMYGLVLSGLAMQMVGNSRPASGSEHHISHLIEMQVLPLPDTALHGEKVGVATALVCDRYHGLLSGPLTASGLSGYTDFPEAEVRAVFGPRAEDVILQENTPDPLAAVAPETLLSRWEELRCLASRTLPTGEAVRDMLRACGAPATLADIGIPEDFAGDLCRYSPFVRRRLTFMRVAMLVG